MIIAHPQDTVNTKPTHAIWGLDAAQLHDRFWATRGVQVVRQGEPSEIVDNAELFLLTDPKTFAIFKLRNLVETLSWMKPDALYVRIHDDQAQGYREQVITNSQDRFIRFERTYHGASGSHLTRVALTPDRHVARLWQSAENPGAGWQLLRKSLPRERRIAASVLGNVYDRTIDSQVMDFLRAMVHVWKRPDMTIPCVRRITGDVWGDDDAKVDPATRFIGPVWIGTGRSIESDATVVGPAIIWDDPDAQPQVETIDWDELEPMDSLTRQMKPQKISSVSRGLKRVFDIGFALVALAVTLPLYPLVMLIIYLEDGRPFFFAHQRETLGGRRFPCIKFRSMWNNAEQIKEELSHENKADGPQFYIENDPRMTRIGAFLRKYNLDELPQFFNVLVGHMSIVGPRPSPYAENQYCPPWREARLSVRPGITGLWQVKRSRLEGLDFQEWIRYDLEYVENASWQLDMWIIWKTFVLYCLRAGTS